MRFNWNYFFSEPYITDTMQGFKDYLTSIHKTGNTQHRIVHTYKRVNDIVTNNSEVEKWLTHNLTPSTVENYCFNIVLAIDSMRTSDSQRNQQNDFTGILQHSSRELRTVNLNPKEE